jgi:glycosyltransferase involved in cell wall biosynthesis
MKIVLAIKQLSHTVGGAERVFCMICSDLVAKGHDVTVITFDNPKAVPFFTLDARVKRVDLSIGDARKPARLIETLVRIKTLREVVRAERPDIAVGFMHSMFVPLACALIGTGIPVAGSEHIVPEHYRTRPGQYLLLIMCAPLISMITVLSESIRSTYPSIVRRRMRILPNPVNLSAHPPKVMSNKTVYNMISVGRLDKQKDHMTLLYSFAKIKDQIPNWNLRIIGEGSLRKELEKIIITLGLDSRVVMPGVTSNINLEYEAADIFVMPSIYEAFGMATAEAMSFGLPVVGFADCPGTNELIQSGVTGILVDAKQDRTNALGQALLVLAHSRKMRQSLGVRAQYEIRQRHDLQYVFKQWEDMFQSVAQSNAL